MAPLLQPSQVAARLNVDPATVRRWCDWHADYLSDSASPGPGGHRRLTEKDMQVLQEVQRLRLAGFATQAINEQLSGMTFAELTTPAVPRTEQDGPGTALAPSPAQFDVESLTAILTPFTARLDAVERNRRDVWIAFGAGAIFTALFFLLIVLLLRLGL